MTTSKNFTDLLNLKDEKFSNISIDGILISTFDFANQIWDNPLLYKYLDHGIEHSYVLTSKALDIFNKISYGDKILSPIERLILGIGALIHDIGMQYNKYPIDGVEEDPSYVRKHHVELGYDMIRSTLEGKFNDERSGPPFLLEDIHKTFLYYGALAGFSHSGRIYWDRLKGSAYSEKKEGGMQTLRLRLIAALIRLADEIHCEYTRVPDLNYIESPLLSETSRAHWTACYYTQEIKITSPGSAGLRMVMNWRVPENISETELQLIRTLLQDLREIKINDESELIKDFLLLDEKSEPYLLEFKISEEPEYLPIKPLPENVKSFIVQSLRPYQFGSKYPETGSNIKELNISPNLDRLKSIAQNFYLTAKGTRTGHFRLNTGWHINKYLNCRRLCGDSLFVHELCHELSSYYSRLNITDVLSIGTSAIRIGSFLSFLMGARFSYTFGKVKIESSITKDDDYTDYELELATFDGGKILIVDDILGVGSVIDETIKQLNKLPNPPDNIRLFTIYRLGDVAHYIDIPSNVEIDYLSWFPDVEYLKEDPATGTCEFCENNSKTIRVED